jgi:hypothetical protein
MGNVIEFEKSQFGTRAIIKSIWQDSFYKLLKDKDVKELELNEGKGWQGDNVDFLQFLPDLKSLIIIDLRIKSIKNIHYLHKLNKIEISTYCNTPIDFNNFPNLIECGFEWREGSESLFECKILLKLFLNSYNKKSSEPFSHLIKLEELALLNSDISDLQGLSLLIHLKSLRLANLAKVKSLHGIGELNQLEELEIYRCKGVNEISELFKLIKLKRLLLLDLGVIDSIKGMENLTDLKAFFFYESTNIADGDISPLFKLKNLNKVSFQNRKHYTHRREDFGKLYS